MMKRLTDLYLHNWKTTVGIIAVLWGAACLYMRYEFSDIFNVRDAFRLLTVPLLVMLGTPLFLIAIDAAVRRRT